MNKKEKYTRAIKVILCIVIIFCFYKIGTTLLEQKYEQDSYEELANIVNRSHTVSENESEDNTKKASKETSESSKNKNMQILKKYQPLYDMNSDLYGWISISGTTVDYPVMLSREDSEYYLHRSFDKSYSYAGVPFVDSECTEDGNLSIVYGHKMKNGTMFSDLLEYDKKDFWENHKDISFDTLYEQRNYRVVAAFYSKIYDKEEKGFHYYNYKELKEENAFQSFCNGVSSSELYDTGESLVYGDQLLLLSTCSYHTKEGRFVVIAKRIG